MPGVDRRAGHAARLHRPHPRLPARLVDHPRRRAPAGRAAGVRRRWTGSGWAAAAWAGAASACWSARCVAVAVPVTVRALGDEAAARAAVPFAGAVPRRGVDRRVRRRPVRRRHRGRAWRCSRSRRPARPRRRCSRLVAGVLLGFGCYLSYGLVLMAPLALAVLVAARRLARRCLGGGRRGRGGRRVHRGRVLVAGRLPPAWSSATTRASPADRPYALLGLGEPGLPRAAPAGPAVLRRCVRRAVAAPRAAPVAAVAAAARPRWPAIAGRRPVRAEQGRGRTDLAAVRGVADRPVRPCCRPAPAAAGSPRRRRPRSPSTTCC